jgi:speckle-type POZ protein
MGHVPHLVLKQMVNFFYNMDYGHDLPDEADISPLQLHAQMFALADQYDILGLGAIALEKYIYRCLESWLPMEFLASIRDVYETTPICIKELRDTVCMTIRKHLPTMLDNTDVAETYEKILEENPGFARDLLKSYVYNPLYGICLSCNSNQPMEALQGRCKKCRKDNSGLFMYHS